MPHQPITVSITNYNGAAYLPWCLEAVGRLDPAPDEILVVDNASSDDSVALLRKRYPEVRLITLSENQGPAVPRNIGIDEAGNNLVFQIDCDVAPHPDCLARLLEAMSQSDDTVVACQPRGLFDDRPDQIHYDGGWFHYLGLLSLIHFFTPVAKADPSKDPRDVDAVISLALLLKKDAVQKAGGYDPAFFILFEDHDLSQRLKMTGKRLLTVPDALVYHREGTEGVSFRSRSGSYPAMRAFLHSRNRWIVLFKNHAWRTLILSLPALMLFESVWFVFSIREGFLFPYIKGKLSFLRMIPRLYGERRKIQASRTLKDKDLLRARDLTFSPLIRRSGFERLIERTLNRMVRLWWNLIKPWVG